MMYFQVTVARGGCDHRWLLELLACPFCGWVCVVSDVSRLWVGFGARWLCLSSGVLGVRLSASDSVL
jgi:hypothetical protein